MLSFEEAIQDFKPITAQAAQDRINSGEKFVLFIGRSTCPFCQRFAPKLSRAAKAKGEPVAFLNSEDQADLPAINQLRKSYSVKTVPGLLVAQAGQVKLVCDSSLSEEAIAAFIA
ncbi:thioredoxin domain-containing protein [Streptococcus macacae]|uniref:Bacteriocin transport accessory protein n=1 Tax=Streptococcus macacae NCTC 11558 TaxID=764298 RepID=G5JWV2_9STRE|nr:thioredoxin domain-containing protein [Streptococcus macacae]EHJ53381.1 putative bacteriocin transport accessory protein [Streptococcus macacae NCTC 11558]SUN79060.1 bacterocin transport accessory protein [Streptococcus macacae NCTC 11558]